MSDEPDLFEPRIPEVDQPQDINKVFDQARKSAGEHAPGPDHRRQIERLISPKVKRKIAVIVYTELKAVTKESLKKSPRLPGWHTKPSAPHWRTRFYV
jgi:hypothetical protein